MRLMAVLAAVLCFVGLLSACAPETVPPLQESVQYDKNGEVVGRTVYTYDEDGNRTKCAYYDVDGVLLSVDAFTFSDGVCVGYTRFAGEQQEVFSVTAQEGNRLQLTTDNKIRECTPEDITVRYIGYGDTGLQFCETFDDKGYRVKYERYNAAGEPYISYAADGDRHYVEVIELANSFSIIEWDAYDTKRVRVYYKVDSGDKLLHEEYDKYGTCIRRIEYGYVNGVRLYRADMVVDSEVIRGITVYNAKDEKILERVPAEEGGSFYVLLPDNAESTDATMHITEISADGTQRNSGEYSVVNGKAVKK